jgi:hypothetical protein
MRLLPTIMMSAEGRRAKPMKITTSLVLNVAPRTDRRRSMKSLMRFLPSTNTRTRSMVRFTRVNP